MLGIIYSIHCLICQALYSPVITFIPAQYPTAVLCVPVVYPTAVLHVPAPVNKSNNCLSYNRAKKNPQHGCRGIYYLSWNCSTKIVTAKRHTRKTNTNNTAPITATAVLMRTHHRTTPLIVSERGGSPCPYRNQKLRPHGSFV